jgi:predicted neuraminidase
LLINRGTRTPAGWAMLFCSVVLVVLLFVKMAPDSTPWTFAVPIPQEPTQGSLALTREVITPKSEKDFVHAASGIATPNGLLAFWYRADYEGANNAELVSARFDGTKWSPTSVVTNSARVSSDLAITVKSLANPVPFRRSDNEIWLFFAASRLSGWATCEIGLMRSFDNGQTWGKVERIYASPFINISHLTKSTPFLFSDGRIGLPVYQEMTKKFPVLLVLNQDGEVIDKRRIGGGGKVGFQPMIVPTGPSTAVAFVRRLRGRKVARILLSRTDDGGQNWTHPVPIDLPNPGGPISAVRYDASHILMAFNDDPAIESNITLALADLDGKTFQRLGVVARMDGQGQKYTVAYPFLTSSAPGVFDIFYSRPLRTINHVRVTSAWIEHGAQPQTAQQ